MTEKQVLVPGPDHPITVTPADRTVTVSLGGRPIATTDRALVLQEASYPAVYYLPLEDVAADALRSSSHETYCPFKGEASYYSLVPTATPSSRDAVWTYVTPHDAVSEIASHVGVLPLVGRATSSVERSRDHARRSSQPSSVEPTLVGRAKSATPRRSSRSRPRVTRPRDASTLSPWPVPSMTSSPRCSPVSTD